MGYFVLYAYVLLLLLLSCFSCVRLCVTPQTAAHRAPPSLGLSRQEYWSGLPFPSPIHESEKSRELHLQAVVAALSVCYVEALVRLCYVMAAARRA